MTVTSLLSHHILTVQLFPEIVSHHVHVTVDPVSGFAVSMTFSVVSVYVFVQLVVVQEIPEGSEVILPDPFPVLLIVNVREVIVVVVPYSLINLPRVPSLS